MWGGCIRLLYMLMANNNLNEELGKHLLKRGNFETVDRIVEETGEKCKVLVN